MIKKYNRIRYSGTFRSKSSGFWDDSNTWQILGVDGNYYDCHNYPKIDNPIIIQSEHTITQRKNESAYLLTNYGTVNKGIYSLTFAAYDSIVQTISNCATVITGDFIHNYDIFIKGLKSDLSLKGTTYQWDEISAMWNFSGPSSEINYLNIKNPGIFTASPVQNLILSNYNGVQPIVKTGWAPSYVNLNWRPIRDAVITGQDNLAIGAWIGANQAAQEPLFGAYNSRGGIYFIPRTTDNKTQSKFNGGLVNGRISISDCSGFNMLIRDNSTNYKHYLNGILMQTISSPSCAPQDLDLYACAANNSDTSVIQGRMLARFFVIASKYIDPKAFYNRLVELLTAMGNMPPTYSNIDLMTFDNGDNLCFIGNNTLGIGKS